MAPQDNAASSTIRPTPPAPAVIYIPEVHSHGAKYFPELRTGDTSKSTIVADIASAQHENMVRVIAFDLAAGKCWDASKEIAADVLDTVLVDYPEVPRWCRDFVHAHLDVRTVFAAERAAA